MYLWCINQTSNIHCPQVNYDGSERTTRVKLDVIIECVRVCGGVWVVVMCVSSLPAANLPK